ELAHFLAAEVLAASRTALAGASGAARPRRTSLRSRGRALACGCGRRCCFVSHVAPSKLIGGRWPIASSCVFDCRRQLPDDEPRTTQDGSTPSLPVLLLPAPLVRAGLCAWRRGLP